ncbi:MAG: putative ABC exporter domain-containing protein [Gemmatimonadetes bacterium]|nr:putative ABC exporter domain-containing protein [Gemmatimonadota bacterium]
MTGALWYLIRTSMRNQLRRQASRLRNPRYAAAFALGIVYFWFFFLRNTRSGAMDANTSAAMLAFAGLAVLAYLAWSWVFGTDRTALAFTRAEVAILFTAPVSRRGLILYKLARSQLGILVSVAIWSVILNRAGDPVASLMRGVGLWVAMSTLSLHRLGIGLWRAGATEHGAGGAKRSVPAMLVFAAAVGAVGWSFWSHWEWVAGAGDATRTFEAVRGIIDLPPAAIVFYPVKLAFAPVVLREPGPWAIALLQALLLLALHVWWVLSSDSAFEEAAAAASEHRAKALEQIRARRGGTAPVSVKSTRRTIPLAATGLPAVAIVWKNALWMLRTNQLRALLIPPVLLLAGLLAFGTGDPKSGIVFAILSGIFILTLLLFGPMSMRNDLRSDLLHLPMLKTLPIPGRDVVLAQVMSGALSVVVSQGLLACVAYAALTLSPGSSPVPAQVLVACAIAAPILLLALNAANFTLHNGAALLFPGWVKLGEYGPGGIEATGQMMLTTVATLLGLVLLLVLPAVAGGVGYLAFSAELGTGVLMGLLVATAILAAETWLMVSGLGRAFETVEPTQIG